MRAVVAEMGGSAILKRTLAWQVIGIVLMTCHILLCKQSIYFYPAVVAVAGWLYAKSPLGGILVFLQILLFGNVLVSVMSADMSYLTFTALQGTNFVILLLLAGIATARMWGRFMNDYRALAIALMIGFACVAVYTLIGASQSSVMSALVYFREFTSPLLAAVVGIDVGRRWGFRTIAACLLYTALASIAVSFIEYAATLDYYTLINAVRYEQLRYAMQTAENTFYTPQDIITRSTSVFFNITGISGSDNLFNNFRLSGSIMSGVSNAYVFAVVGLAAVSLKRSWWLLIILPMLVVMGVKGAVLLLLFSVGLWVVWLLTKNKWALAVIGLGLAVVYIGAGIYIGINNNDFHVMGFMGGLRSLLSSPLGHGIGVGGNLSEKANAGFTWAQFQTSGADFAVESAVGVLIYQMGLAAIAVYAVIVVVIRKAPLGGSRFYIRPVRSDLWFIALAMVMLNGVFQEEAYSPYAAGLIMLMCGVLTGNGRRQGVIIATTTEQLGRLK